MGRRLASQSDHHLGVRVRIRERGVAFGAGVSLGPPENGYLVDAGPSRIKPLENDVTVRQLEDVVAVPESSVRIDDAPVHEALHEAGAKTLGLGLVHHRPTRRDTITETKAVVVDVDELGPEGLLRHHEVEDRLTAGARRQNHSNGSCQNDYRNRDTELLAHCYLLCCMTGNPHNPLENPGTSSARLHSWAAQGPLAEWLNMGLGGGGAIRTAESLERRILMNVFRGTGVDMKRILVVALLATVALPGVPGYAADKARTREEKVPYVGSAVPTVAGGFNCAGFDQWSGQPGVGCVWFRPTGTDRAVSPSIADATGLDVSAWVVQSKESPSGAYTWSRVERFCTQTDEPVALDARADIVYVVLWQARCIDGTPAVATTGEVTFTIHQR